MGPCHLLRVMEGRSSSTNYEPALEPSIRTYHCILISQAFFSKQLMSCLHRKSSLVCEAQGGRTLGIFGALAPDHYKKVLSKKGQDGAGGVGYFELDDVTAASVQAKSPNRSSSPLDAGINFIVDLMDEEESPAHRYMYSQYSKVGQPVSTTPPPKRLSPVHHEDFYQSVAIQSLTGILTNPVLTVYHSMVVQAIMFIFKSMTLVLLSFCPQLSLVLSTPLEQAVLMIFENSC